jgi:hypothetical protein
MVGAMAVVTTRHTRSPRSFPKPAQDHRYSSRFLGNTVAFDFNMVRCPSNVRKLLELVRDFDVRKRKHC